MLSALTRLLSMPPVQTGLVLGGTAATRAYQPSLVDRSRNDQAIITAGSIAAGYLAANLVERVIGLVSTATGVDRGYSAATLGAIAAVVARADLSPALQTTAAVARDAAAVSATLAVARSGPTGRLGLALEATAAGAAMAEGLRHQLGLYADDGRSAPPTEDVVASLGTGTAIAGFVWALVAAERAVAAAFADTASRLGGPRWIWRTGAHGALLGGAALIARTGAKRFLGSLDAAADETEAAYANPPTSQTLSGGQGSAVDHATIGVPGRRFVAEAVPHEEINRVMGGDTAADPIRVYVGIDTAGTVDARVALAVAELRRTAAFDRGLLIVGSPSGSGYLNYITVEAAEYFSRGDVATVTIQYGKRPSILSLDRLKLAQRQHRALVDAIRDELARRDAGNRPRLVLYGESLGAQTSQDAFPQPGYDSLAERLVDHALWVGTPYPTRFRQAVLSASPGDPRFGRSASIADRDPAATYHFLEHHEDPVTLFTPALFLRRPPWLGDPAERPPNVPRTQQWVPAITFLQTVFDTKNATEIEPGEFNAFAHDYRADLAEWVRAAYAIEDVSDEQMARVEDALRRSEIERASKTTAR